MKMKFPRMNKYFKFLFIVLLLIFIVICASFKVLIHGYEKQVNILNEVTNSIRRNHISTMIQYANEIASKQADDIAERVTIKVKNAYPDISVLENELNSGNLNDTKFIHILYDEILHDDLFDINNANNRLIVFLEDGYIVDNQIRKYNKVYHRFGEDQQIDSKAVFDTFVMGADSMDNHIFYSKSGIEYPSGAKIIMSVSQEEFYNRILNDLDNLDSYEVYAVSYITTDGDIFGSKDVSSDLKRNHTHKIIIVQSFNVNDILLAKTDASYKEAIKCNETLADQMHDHILLHSFFFILFFILFLFSTLMTVFIFINGKKCFYCSARLEENNDKYLAQASKLIEEKSTDNSKNS